MGKTHRPSELKNSAELTRHSEHFKDGLEKSRTKESFIWIIAVHDEDLLCDSMTFWGITLPDEIRHSTNSDQEFENWKFGAGGFEEVMDRFSLAELGSFRHGFLLMGCDRCCVKEHSTPIVLCPGTLQPLHSTAFQTIYGKPPNSNQEKDFLVLGVVGGLFGAYVNPSLTGTLPIGVLILQSQPFCL